MLTIETRRSRLAAAVRRSSGSSASVSRTGASKFSFMWRSMFSHPPSSNRPRHDAPALLTSRCSSPPCSRCTTSRTRCGASASVRSTAITVAPPSWAASSFRCCSRRATRISLASGSRAIRRAAASPMPLEAPVTRATKGEPGVALTAADPIRPPAAQRPQREVQRREQLGAPRHLHEHLAQVRAGDDLARARRGSGGSAGADCSARSRSRSPAPRPTGSSLPAST